MAFHLPKGYTRSDELKDFPKPFNFDWLCNGHLFDSDVFSIVPTSYKLKKDKRIMGLIFFFSFIQAIYWGGAIRTGCQVHEFGQIHITDEG